MSREVIFIAGVHGVGKGVLSGEISEKLSLPHYTASDLIKREKGGVTDIEKKVKDADENQDYLVSAINRLPSKENLIILDGHFCLHSGGGIYVVPLKTFQNIPLKRIVLLVDNEEDIYSRIHRRGGAALSVSVIENLQRKEVEQAKLVAHSLNIPLYVSGIGKTLEIIEWLKSHC